MKKDICTLSDYNYLYKGLVLYESLKLVNTDFNLYYLCVDLKSYDKLVSLNLPDIIPLYVGDISELRKESKMPYKEYCWSLASRLCQYLITNKNIADILYIDSDIVFYRNLEAIYSSVANKSIGIIPHVHVPVGHPVGGYNVGIIYFKNDEIGKRCLSLWVDCVINPDGPFRVSHGTCGDQKYLELFELYFPDAVTVIFKGARHGAPWNLALYNFDTFNMENVETTYEGAKEPLVFVHFSHFEPKYDLDTYAPFWGYSEEIMKIPAIRTIYDDYYRKCKEVHVRHKV